MRALETLQSEAQATDILRRALRLEREGYTHPAVLRGRVGAIALVWLAGLGAVIASFIALVRSSGSTGQYQLLYSYFLFLSAATFVAASIGVFLVLWNAYVHQYILAIRAQEEMVEYMGDSVAEAALNLAADADFRRQLLVEVVSVNIASEDKADALAGETVKRLAEKARSAAANM